MVNLPLKYSSQEPLEVSQVGDATLRIKWSDGHESVYSSNFLRKICPCAECEEKERKGSGLRIIVGPVVTSVKALKVSQVGRYALSFVWSDGHSTGIYTYDLLRSVCQCSSCLEAERENHPNGRF